MFVTSCKRHHMLTYWFMFLLPAFASLAVSVKPASSRRRLEASWLAVIVVLALLIGLRHQVGGDWGTYEKHYFEMVGASLAEVLDSSDPGYYVINWLSTLVDGGIYTVNLICGVIFSVGLVAFCRNQPRPWLALTVAIPYLVVVVGMGYSRQGLALGFAMLGLVALARGRNAWFVLSVALAATCHKSAVLLVPLAILATPRGRIWTALWVGVTAVVLYWLLLADSVDSLVTNYLEAEYQSEGAAVRIAMNALPAALLLLFRKRFVWPPAERNLWTTMSILALACVAWLLLSSSSTAVDRVALYLIPLQLFVFARLPDLLGRGNAKRVGVIAVVLYYGIVLFVWLFFANHAYAWVPYRFYLFE